MKQIPPYAHLKAEGAVIGAICRGQLPGTARDLIEPIGLWPIISKCWQSDPPSRATADVLLVDLHALVCRPALTRHSFQIRIVMMTRFEQIKIHAGTPTTINDHVAEPPASGSVAQEDMTLVEHMVSGHEKNLLETSKPGFTSDHAAALAKMSTRATTPQLDIARSNFKSDSHLPASSVSCPPLTSDASSRTPSPRDFNTALSETNSQRSSSPPLARSSSQNHTPGSPSLVNATGNDHVDPSTSAPHDPPTDSVYRDSTLSAMVDLDLNATPEIVGSDHTIQKWQKHCKKYEQRAKNNIAYRNFVIGDMALFLPTRKAPAWAAFNVGSPHHFLKPDGRLKEQLKSRKWYIARIISVAPKVVDSADPNTNPYGLGHGVTYVALEVEDMTSSQARPSTGSAMTDVEPKQRSTRSAPAPPVVTEDSSPGLGFGGTAAGNWADAWISKVEILTSQPTRENLPPIKTNAKLVQNKEPKIMPTSTNIDQDQSPLPPPATSYPHSPTAPSSQLADDATSSSKSPSSVTVRDEPQSRPALSPIIPPNSYPTTLRSYQKMCKFYRNCAREKITYRNFAVGDLALFLTTGNSPVKPWAAFNTSLPHYFLEVKGHLTEILKSREWVLARISSIDGRVVNSEDPKGNPYDLVDGAKYFILGVDDWTRDKTILKSSSLPPTSIKLFAERLRGDEAT
ncbi:oligomeric, coiled-coil, peripheral membrane protein [Tulasnella sp. 330]|nr:oligomeric, coiled-coil, peripheral membrane protein [Tulasnella sp. 330]KAG8870607.1 oligomeric, coiled-coil, peripheral membrane protein [Tulasnella sp. 331]